MKELVQVLVQVNELCANTTPYSFGPREKTLFTGAMKEIVKWHQANSPFYNNLLNKNDFNPETIDNLEDCASIPFVLAQFFKTHEVLSIPRDKVFAHFTSSGTSGQKSQIFFDQRSLLAGQKMLDSIFDYYGWYTPTQKTNYLLFSYELEGDSKLGTAHTDNFLCKYAPIQNLFTALRISEPGRHEFDAFGCIEVLKKYEKEGLPVRIFGYPAFLYFTLKRMNELKMKPLKLAGDSLVFLGGGWKANSDQAISKAELYEKIENQLGIQNHRIRDGFGSVEHPVPYVECENHEFHVPVWSQVHVRDVRTLKLVPGGQHGFLHFLTPFITSMPAHSVLMGDLASLFDGKDCGCKIKTSFFRVHGRAGTSKNRSCAVAAAELLRK